MKTFLIHFLATLGIIFLIVILLLAYGYFSDAFGIRSLMGGSYATPSSGSGGDGSGSVDKNPLLSPSQERTLEQFGIDPASLPSEITPEMEACFEEKLGKERTEEIKAGASPTTADFFKARSCLE